jgi:hypothetical protein
VFKGRGTRSPERFAHQLNSSAHALRYKCMMQCHWPHMNMLMLKSTPECSWHDWRAHTLMEVMKARGVLGIKGRQAPTLDADFNGSKL